jgi:hypothetical protein
MTNQPTYAGFVRSFEGFLGMSREALLREMAKARRLRQEEGYTPSLRLSDDDWMIDDDEPTSATEHSRASIAIPFPETDDPAEMIARMIQQVCLSLCDHFGMTWRDVPAAAHRREVVLGSVILLAVEQVQFYLLAAPPVDGAHAPHSAFGQGLLVDADAVPDQKRVEYAQVGQVPWPGYRLRFSDAAAIAVRAAYEEGGHLGDIAAFRDADGTWHARCTWLPEALPLPALERAGVNGEQSTSSPSSEDEG